MFYCSSVSLPCSGSAMLTRGHTVLPRDSTPSLLPFTLLWWAFINHVDIIKNIQIPHFTMKTFTYVTSLFVFQSRGARAVFQLYPENSEQVGGKNGVILCFMMVCVLMCLQSDVRIPSLTSSLPLSLSKAWADHVAGHEGGLQWRDGGGLPQQQQG